VQSTIDVLDSRQTKANYNQALRTPREPGSSVSSVWLRTGRTRFDPRQRQRIFHLVSMSRPALEPTQPPVQWVTGVLSPGVNRGRGMTLTTNPPLVPRSWMSRGYTSSPPAPSWVSCGTALPLHFTKKKCTRKNNNNNNNNEVYRWQNIVSQEVYSIWMLINQI
jgi:hypothetical protein